MKRLLPILMLAVLPTPVLAQQYGSPGYSYDQECYEDVYTEEYVPGTRSRPGYVRRNTDRVRVPCRNQQVHPQPYPPHGNGYGPPQDDNSCVEGAIIGGILGGGAGAAASRGDGRWWAIPLGVVGGSMVGCQIDGG